MVTLESQNVTRLRDFRNASVPVTDFRDRKRKTQKFAQCWCYKHGMGLNMVGWRPNIKKIKLLKSIVSAFEPIAQKNGETPTG